MARSSSNGPTKAAPARVFQAFSDPVAKAKWFKPPEGWRPEVQTMDFREGGRETSEGGPVDGPTILYDAVFQNIVRDQRIVSSYAMTVDSRQISVSLTTLELRPIADGIHLVLTEQGVYFDGPEAPAMREHGIAEMLDVLGQDARVTRRPPLPAR